MRMVNHQIIGFYALLVWLSKIFLLLASSLRLTRLYVKRSLRTVSVIILKSVCEICQVINNTLLFFVHRGLQNSVNCVGSYCSSLLNTVFFPCLVCTYYCSQFFATFYYCLTNQIFVKHVI